MTIYCAACASLDAFSKRTAQVDIALERLIRAWTVEHDGADPDPRTIATLERRAVLASRPGKTHGIDAATLQQQWEDEATAVGAAFKGLSASDQEVLALFYFADMAPPDMGQVLGCSVAAVHKRLHRARVRLRQQLEGDGDAEPEA